MLFHVGFFFPLPFDLFLLGKEVYQNIILLKSIFKEFAMPSESGNAQTLKYIFRVLALGVSEQNFLFSFVIWMGQP